MTDQLAAIRELRELNDSLTRWRMPEEEPTNIAGIQSKLINGLLENCPWLLDAAERGMEAQEPDMVAGLRGIIARGDSQLTTLTADRDAAVAERDRLRAFISDVLEMTDFENPDSYASDDPYTCLEVIAAEARRLAQGINP